MNLPILRIVHSTEVGMFALLDPLNEVLRIDSNPRHLENWALINLNAHVSHEYALVKA